MSTPPTTKVEYQLDDLMQQSSKVDINTIEWISNVFISIQSKVTEPRWMRRTKFYCYIMDQDRNSIRITDYITIPNKQYDQRKKSLKIDSNIILKLFQNIQNGKVSGISGLHLWAREGIYHYPSTTRVKYFIDPILGEPGKKIKLSKDTAPGIVCKNCDNYLLKFSEGSLQVDDFTQKNCPYCGQELKTSKRTRKYIRISLTKNAPVNILYHGLQFQINLNGRDINIPITVKKTNDLFRNFQHLTGNQIGPFRIKLGYAGWRSVDINLLDIEPMSLDDSEWHEAEIFPEDMLM